MDFGVHKLEKTPKSSKEDLTLAEKHTMSKAVMIVQALGRRSIGNMPYSLMSIS